MFSKSKINAYVQITRLDKPIGIMLLLWPTYWGLWFAAQGMPDFSTWLIFTLGVVLMRSAGCVLNDIADRKVDGLVERTQMRPLIQGLISTKEAILLALILIFIAFVLVLFTNIMTILMAIPALALAASYPYMKRYTYLPQVVLGAAFAWSIPMAFTASIDTVTNITWLLFSANLLWTVAYDTQYAMVDRSDDLKAGIKSTAILFGDADLVIISILQATSLAILLLAGIEAQLHWIFYSSLIICLALFCYQLFITKERLRENCFSAFLHNNWIGLTVFVGILLDYLIY